VGVPRGGGVRTGLEERPDGFVDHGNFYKRFIALEDIERFEERPSPIPKAARVVMVLREDHHVRFVVGRVKIAQGVWQHRKVVWDGGETRDVVAVLNERIGATVPADA
jgi:hypothetical protein